MSETTQQPPPAATPPQPTPTDPFDRIRAFGAARPAHGRWIGGVAAGLARRWSLDPLLVRGLFVALAIAGGIGLLAYGLAWALLPEEDGRIHLQQIGRGDVSAGLFGSIGFVLLFVVAAGDGGNGPFWWGSFPGAVVVGLIIAGAIWYSSDQRKRGQGRPAVPPGAAQAQPYTAVPYGTSAYPPPGTPVPPYYGTPPGPVPPVPPGRPKAKVSHRITRISLGLAVLAAVAVIIAGQASDSEGATVAVLAMAAALGVLAIGVVLAGLGGRKAGGLAPLGVLLTIALLIGAAVSAAPLDDDSDVSLVGDRSWRPASVQAAEREWNLGAGEATLWLTDPALTAGSSAADRLDVTAQVGAGTLTIVLPPGVPAEVRAELGAGELTRPDGTTIEVRGDRDQHDYTVTSGPAGDPVMSIEARVGLGTIEVRTGTPGAITPLPARSAGPAPTVSVTPPATPPATPAPSAAPIPTP